MRLGSGPPSISSVAPARQETATILLDRGADRRSVGLHRGGIGDFEFDDEVGRHVSLPWLIYAGLQPQSLRCRTVEPPRLRV
jgi:hypothetical protein